AGFTVEKKPGHGRKKERLEAQLSSGSERNTRPVPRRVAVIGAGIAGACVARAFVRRGCQVAVYDKAEQIGVGASGNPLALVMPRLDAADGPGPRGLVEAYLFAKRFYRELGPEAAVELVARHRPRGEKEIQRFAKLMADPPLDETLLQAEAGALKHIGAIAV